MVVLREGMCPGLDEDLVRDLRAADVKTGQWMWGSLEQSV